MSKKESVRPPEEWLVSFDHIEGDDQEDTALLREMANEAFQYIQTQKWCLNIKERFFADGVGGIVAIFLFQVNIKKLGDDQWIWVIVGDVPPAYFIYKQPDSPRSALNHYANSLEAWAKEAQHGRLLQNSMPMNVPATPEFAAMALSRAATLRTHILPSIR